MKIEAITIREIQMPLVHFFETSFGRTTSRRILLITAHCEGLNGWAECVAGENPYYSDEWVQTAWATICDYLAPALIGRTLNQARECGALVAQVRGHRMAKAAVENALWDVEAQQKKQPLWKLLGGTRSEIACGVSIGIQDSVEQLLGKVEAELAAGYRRIKVKVKPGWDINVLERVRSRWPNILLSCDANSAYRLSEVEHLRKFDQFNLLMIEQPLWNDDIYFHARLQKQLKTKICLDESIRNARDAEAAIELGACRIINIKVGRVGGFTEAKSVHDVCQAHNIPVWCGGMLESGVGRAHNVALSTLENFRLPGDVSASKRYWKEDIIEPEVEVSPQGTTAIKDEPGTGYRVREDLIEKLTVRKQTLRTAAAGQ
ncbi:MAG: o-succinylbenzoate synthase [Acidobacteria bacterium]|nr:MAG: o-succinylbenzoate synthase [Acidobacteriota bacterium]PYY08580.1 MAG: o-succinylbenzoate synthase [Acidobacteriota bacterium]